MKVGTKSLLFGVHQVIIHPIFVFIAWWKLFGFPYDPRLWVAFIVHDWGYWGKKNMDGKGEGEIHPLLGAIIMHKLFDPPMSIKRKNNDGFKWYHFTLYHSRYYAKLSANPISKLCIADKYVFCIQPKWMYIPLATLSGEIYEYMDENKNRSKISFASKSDWFDHVHKYMRNWVKVELEKIIETEAVALVNKYKDYIVMPVLMHPVNSSQISYVGYDRKKKELFVTFKNGSTYKFEAVDHSMYDNMMKVTDNSIGNYFSMFIKDKYKTSKIK